MSSSESSDVRQLRWLVARILREDPVRGPRIVSTVVHEAVWGGLDPYGPHPRPSEERPQTPIALGHSGPPPRPSVEQRRHASDPVSEPLSDPFFDTPGAQHRSPSLPAVPAGGPRGSARIVSVVEETVPGNARFGTDILDKLFPQIAASSPSQNETPSKRKRRRSSPTITAAQFVPAAQPTAPPAAVAVAPPALSATPPSPAAAPRSPTPAPAPQPAEGPQPSGALPVQEAPTSKKKRKSSRNPLTQTQQVEKLLDDIIAEGPNVPRDQH